MRMHTAELVIQAAAKVLQDFVDGYPVDKLTLDWAATTAIANLCRTRPIADPRRITDAIEQRDAVRKILKEANHG